MVEEIFIVGMREGTQPELSERVRAEPGHERRQSGEEERDEEKEDERRERASRPREQPRTKTLHAKMRRFK